MSERRRWFADGGTIEVMHVKPGDVILSGEEFKKIKYHLDLIDQRYATSPEMAAYSALEILEAARKRSEG